MSETRRNQRGRAQRRGDAEQKEKEGNEISLAGLSSPLRLRGSARDLDGLEELTTRSMQVRAQTANEEERSIEAVIATETPVEVWDWRRDEMVDEVLLISGTELPRQLPLLASHDRWSLDSMLGSARNLRRDDGEIVSRLFFTKGDDEAEKAWNKARQGHLTDVSVGYRVEESVEIQPNGTATVAGRKFRAGKRAMRIVTKWRLREVSLVPIGADQAAKLRQASITKGETMKKELRAYLETIGLRDEATDAQAEEFFQGLKDEQRTRADGIKEGKRTAPPADPPPADPPPAKPPANDGGRTAPPADPPPDLKEIARKAVAEDRQRQRRLKELASKDVPAELLERAIDEEWDEARAAPVFLAALRDARQQGVGPALEPTAIHSRSHDVDCNVRSLAAGLLIQNNLDPTQCREYDTECSRTGAAFSEQDADRGDEFARLPALDICREAVRIDTGRYIREPSECVRAALSGGTLSYVFGTNIYAKLVAGWETIGDSTEGWCDEEDVPNFLTQEEITLNVDGTPEMHGRGDTATDATLGDTHETYRAYRFTKKATLDELDIINDRLGAVMKVPVEMGRAFRRMRPNMVYSSLLTNAALVADSTPVFHADHSNLTSAALDATSLSAALTAMASQRLAATTSKAREVLGIQGRFVILPTALQWTGAQLLNSVALAKTHADKTDPNYMPVNPVGPSVIKQVIGDNLTLVSDDRIGAVGCWNPMTNRMVTGSATNWFLSAGPYRGVRVLYLRGANRQPIVRNYALDRGEYGIGFDMKLDIGSKIMDYRGLHKSSGTT